MFVETERLSLKVLKRDKVALRHLAVAEGEPMSVVIRRILRRELKRRNFLPDDFDVIQEEKQPNEGHTSVVTK